ncbi:hypothetical protein MFLAVUS_006740 [Mucor flavus]|uniref:Kinetochore protein Nuf2 N-terminal domain-containing protein n=1 Tax=Mucor flavus TaxID=439312 RepID=A0ABP9Z2D3_9FUNG
MEDYKPRLKPVEELVSILQQMNLRVSKRDLYDPSSRRTTIIFESFVAMFCPENYGLIKEAQTEATNRIITSTGSSLDTSSHETLVIFEIFRSFLKTIRFSEIALTDLTNPTSRRIIPIYNAVVHYALHCETSAEEYRPWAEKIEEESILIEEAKKIEEDRRRELNHKIDQNLKDEEERQELESINEKLMIELDDLKEEADTMLSTLEDRKKETRKLKDTLQGSQYVYLENRDNLGDYSQYRDIDLDEGLRECDSLRYRIEDITKKLAQRQSLAHNFTTELTLKKTILQDIKMCTRSLLNIKSKTAEINRQVKRTEAAQRELENVSEEELEKSKMLSEIKMEMTNCQVEMELIEEQAAKSAETRELFHKYTEEKNNELKKIIEENRVKESECKEEMKGYEEEHQKLIYLYNYQMHQVTNKIASIQSNIERLYQQSQN